MLHIIIFTNGTLTFLFFLSFFLTLFRSIGATACIYIKSRSALLPRLFYVCASYDFLISHTMAYIILIYRPKVI